MTAEERLNRVREARIEYTRLLTKLEELETIATKITPTISDMPKGNNSRPKDDVWAELIDYRTACEEEIRYYLKASAELEKELECIRSARIRTAMKYRYIDNYKEADIAEEMCYSERAIRMFLQKGKRIYLEQYQGEQSHER